MAGVLTINWVQKRPPPEQHCLHCLQNQLQGPGVGGVGGRRLPAPGERCRDVAGAIWFSHSIICYGRWSSLTSCSWHMRGRCCSSHNCVFRVPLSSLSCCTSLLSLDTITTKDCTISMVQMPFARTTSSCTPRESLSPIHEPVHWISVDNASFWLLLENECSFAVSPVSFL
jgi:hypothetical protein